MNIKAFIKFQNFKYSIIIQNERIIKPINSLKNTTIKIKRYTYCSNVAKVKCETE